MKELSEKEFFSLPRGTVIITPEGYDYLMGGEVLYPDNPGEPFSVIRWHKFNYKGCRVAADEETKLYFEKLNFNGYKWNQETGNMERAMVITELEKSILSILKDVAYQGSFGNPTEKYLLEKVDKIRKQIVESIDVETMKERFINNLPVYTVIHESVDKKLWGEPYKKGIEDTLNKIK